MTKPIVLLDLDDTLLDFHKAERIAIAKTFVKFGIEPDEVCEFDSERYYSEEKYDNQKERAKELLESMIAQ